MRPITVAALLALALTPIGQPVSAEQADARSAPVTAPAAARPPEWAQPVEVAGAPNLNRVTSNLYRSAQPTAAGFRTLARDTGIKTVVSLRTFHSDASLIEGTGIKLIRVPMNTWHIETEDVVRALAAIHRAEAQGGVLLHCQHGADRTGLIMALYRVLYQGWSKDAAIAEMKGGAFGYHAVWGNILRYLRQTDIPEMARMVVAVQR